MSGTACSASGVLPRRRGWPRRPAACVAVVAVLVAAVLVEPVAHASVAHGAAAAAVVKKCRQFTLLRVKHGHRVDVRVKKCVRVPSAACKVTWSKKRHDGKVVLREGNPVWVASVSCAKRDPIVGDWSVTYGAPAVVTMSRSSTGYTVTAKSLIRVVGASCDLPTGTVLATFSGSGTSYSGRHGLWFPSDCSFASWTPINLTLKATAKGVGSTLTAVFKAHYNLVFTKLG